MATSNGCQLAVCSKVTTGPGSAAAQSCHRKKPGRDASPFPPRPVPRAGARRKAAKERRGPPHQDPQAPHGAASSGQRQRRQQHTRRQRARLRWRAAGGDASRSGRDGRRVPHRVDPPGGSCRVAGCGPHQCPPSCGNGGAGSGQGGGGPGGWRALRAAARVGGGPYERRPSASGGSVAGGGGGAERARGGGARSGAPRRTAGGGRRVATTAGVGRGRRKRRQEWQKRVRGAPGRGGGNVARRRGEAGNRTPKVTLGHLLDPRQRAQA